MARPTPLQVRNSAQVLGEHFRAWRKLQKLTTVQVADRAGITRGTLRRLEEGETTVSLDVVLRVARALGRLDALVVAMDPYETDLGRARADWLLPQRVRQ